MSRVSKKSDAHGGHARRGNRLRPRRWSRVYWHLRCLRNAMESVVMHHIAEQNRRVLVDYGAGNSPYRPLFEPAVDRYETADLSTAIESTSIRINEDGTLPLADAYADVVLSSQVLEHVRDPALYLAECRRVLSEQGVLVLSTHGVWKYHPDPTDFWRWTCDGLCKTVEQGGFQVIERYGLVGPAATGLQIFQDATLRWVPPPIRALYCWPMQIAMQFFDWITPERIRNSDASVYVVIAQPRG